MTLRTSLVIDGDAKGAAQAAAEASAGLNRLEAATAAETAATKAATAAQAAHNAILRQGAQVRQNLIFQLNDIGVSLASGMNPAMVAIQQGSQLLTGPGGLGGAVKELGNLAVSLASRFAPIGAVVAAIGAGIAGMQAAINSAGASVQVSFGDVALGALQTFGDYIWDTVGPAVSGIAKWFGDAWNASWPTIKNFGNLLIGTFAGAFDAMKAVWSSLPDVMGDMVFSAANAVLDGIKWLINSAIDRFNDLRHLVGMDKKDDFLGLGPDLFRIANPYAGAAGNAAKLMGGAFQGAMSTDYLGGFFNDVAVHARANATKRNAGETDADGAKKAAAIDRVTKAVDAQRDAWSALADVGGNAFDKLTDSILSGGRDIVGTLQSIGGELAKTAFQMAITNPLKNFAFGGSAPTFGGNWLSSLFGSFGGMGGLKSLPGLGGLTGSVKSYAGGGFTGYGPRHGGLDGRGGFLSLLHPNETVIDHSMSARGGGGVVININNNAGVDVSARQTGVDAAGRAMIAIAVNEATKRVEDKMAAGRYRSYGVVPGTRRT